MDADCDDGLFCSGHELCVGGVCATGANPCTIHEVCDEDYAVCVPDGDGDGVPDSVDNCPDDANAYQADIDGDDVGDFCDNCPSVVNPDQSDGDRDGIGEACDNCPFDPNPGQTDADGDGCGDVCDGDCLCESDADCDDGLACTGDTCVGATGTCVFSSVDAACDDGLFCTGFGTCDPGDPDADRNGCVMTGNPCGGLTPVCDEANDWCLPCSTDADCEDGVSCTTDTCEAGGFCVNSHENARCDDGQFCTDDDFCDPTDPRADATTGCVNVTDPCNCTRNDYPCGGMYCDRKLCNEVTDTCDDCVSNAQCDDGVTCTEDLCNGITGTCSSLPNDYNCPDLDFCDPEHPDADSNGCVQPGNPCRNPTPICHAIDDTCRPCTSNGECDDGVVCTDDMCDVGTGSCWSLDSCPGTEVCNLATGQCG